ncbi:MAG: 4'-phosphopantetheinyl transferase superfamily protein [Bifidobacteriaceae bacterium]|jgi:4'-phosphopantetheinyl transferase|nr:4'-phosphopantetheinyl transferase superfamily protein [Bifidobacteriaceae bacterium]
MAMIFYHQFQPRDLTESNLNSLIHKLPDFRKRQAQQYYFSEDTWLSVTGFLLLAFALGYVPESFSYNQYGKPELEGVCFNISHTAGSACVLIDSQMCGVDIEKFTKTPPWEIMPQVFTRGEISWIGREPLKFWEVWTSKESWVKFWGKGLSFPIPLNECSVSGYPIQTFMLKEHLISACLMLRRGQSVSDIQLQSVSFDQLMSI